MAASRNAPRIASDGSSSPALVGFDSVRSNSSASARRRARRARVRRFGSRLTGAREEKSGSRRCRRSCALRTRRPRPHGHAWRPWRGDGSRDRRSLPDDASPSPDGYPSRADAVCFHRVGGLYPRRAPGNNGTRRPSGTNRPDRARRRRRDGWPRSAPLPGLGGGCYDAGRACRSPSHSWPRTVALTAAPDRPGA